MKSTQKHILLPFLCLLLNQPICYAIPQDDANERSSQQADEVSFKGSGASSEVLNLQVNKTSLLALMIAPLATGVIAYACKLSPFGIISALNSEQLAGEYYLMSTMPHTNNAIEEKFPHAQAWYQSLIKKYPAAHFDTKSFIETPKKSNDSSNAHTNETRWQCIPGQIQSPFDALEKIDAIYKKKINNKQLTPYEQHILSCYEWMILHEAGHLENNDSTIRKPLVFVSTAAALEAGYQTHKRKTIISSVPKSLPRRFGRGFAILTIMTSAHVILNRFYTRHIENDADAFANLHADDDALCAGERWFEVMNINDKLTSSYEIHDPQVASIIKNIRYPFSTHPTNKSRAQNIESEIEHRRQSTK